MASQRIKGVTIQINGDTTDLSKKLKDLDSQISKTNSELKDVNKLLKLDPKNTELLAQKQELLAKQIGNTKDRVNELKAAQESMKDATGNIPEDQAEAYNALTRELVQTESQLKKLEEQAKEFGSVTQQQVITALNEVSEKADQVAKKTKVLSTAAAGLATALVANAVSAGAAADDLNTLAQQTGFSVEELQKMQYAADIVDVSVEDMTGSIAKMENKLRTNTEAFDELGVAVYGSNGTMRGATEIWYDTLQALSQIPNETERDAKAMEIFGKSANQLAGIVDDGGASLKELGQQAEDAGLIMSQDGVDAANQFNDAIDQLKATATASFFEAGAALATSLIPVMQELLQVVTEVLTWFGNLDGGVQKFLVTVALLVAAISPVAKLISSISSAAQVLIPLVSNIGSLFTGLAGIGTKLVTVLAGISPTTMIIVAALGALVAAGVALYKNWDTVKAKAIELKDKVVGVFNSMKEGIKNALSAIKLPHFKITGKFSIVPPSVPKLSVDWYKKAMSQPYLLDGATIFGVNSRGQLMGGGEAGREVIMSEERMKSMSGNSITNNIVINQQPGEDSNALADRVIERMQFKMARGM